MAEHLPDYLVQGERARLFPVLSTTSKEGRTTAIVLACLDKIDEFAASLLQTLGVKVGKRTAIDTYTEVVFQTQPSDIKDRPDGLIVVRTATREWRALVEAKVGTADLEPDQIERYRSLAKANGADCVVTISNQFATDPASHPLPDVRKSKSKIPVFHWSWMHILTTADLLISNDAVDDSDQTLLLNELRRFLSHDSAGVRGFDRMPPEWTALNKLISSGGAVPAKSMDATAVLEAWHQETRDLALILSRLTEASVHERVPKKLREDPAARLADALTLLREDHALHVSLDIPDAAAPLDIIASIARRSIEVGMTLKAPEDRKSSKARLNWLLRQIKTSEADDLFIRLLWPGRSEATQFSLNDLRADPSLIDADKEHLQVRAFHVFASRRLGARFTQQTNFIVDVERLVPEFYANVGSGLSQWSRSAPQIKKDRTSAEDVSLDAIEDDAEALSREG